MPNLKNIFVSETSSSFYGFTSRPTCTQVTDITPDIFLPVTLPAQDPHATTFTVKCVFTLPRITQYTTPNAVSTWHELDTCKMGVFPHKVTSVGPGRKLWT